MWIDFDELPDTARVWVYQANRPLSAGDVATVQELLKSALHQWAAHGQPLLASAQVVENRFVVIGVDEEYTLPSGCSIDASVRTLQQIGEQITADFSDRSAAVLTADGSVVTYPLPAIKAAVMNGTITPATTVINTLVKNKAEFLADWHIPAAHTWLKRYFVSSVA